MVALCLCSLIYGDNFVHCVYYFHVVVPNLHTNCTQHEGGKATCIPVFEIFNHKRTVSLYELAIPPWNSIHRIPLELLLSFSCLSSILIFPSISTFVLKLLLHEQMQTLVIPKPYTIAKYLRRTVNSSNLLPAINTSSTWWRNKIQWFYESLWIFERFSTGGGRYFYCPVDTWLYMMLADIKSEHGGVFTIE